MRDRLFDFAADFKNPTKRSSVIIRPGVHAGKQEVWKGDEPVTGGSAWWLERRTRAAADRGSRGLRREWCSDDEEGNQGETRAYMGGHG